jgi:hypothetical protein
LEAAFRDDARRTIISKSDATRAVTIFQHLAGFNDVPIGKPGGRREESAGN